MAQWWGHEEMSLDKEKSKRTMIYYASPVGLKYGYFSSTVKQRQLDFLARHNRD